MDHHVERPARTRRHLLTGEQLAAHADASPGGRAGSHRRQGNGLRIHRTYILVVSLATLVLVGVAIAVASASM